MAATWQKNELLGAKRRCDLLIRDANAARAWRGTDFTGKVLISLSSHLYRAALGTVTNKRRPLAFDDIEATTISENLDDLNAVGHGLQTGDGPVFLTGIPAPPPPLAADTPYWVIKVNDDRLSLAETLADAYAGVAVFWLAPGSMPVTIIDDPDTARGVDGEWTYEATQAETNVDGSEIAVTVLDDDYEAYTTVILASSSGDVWSQHAESGNSFADLVRGIWAVITGETTGDFTTGTYGFTDPATGTKTRVTVTSDATGRKVVVLGDLT